MSLRIPPNQDIIIVGASGDLSRRKLLPAIYNLSVQGLLPDRGKVLGTARTDMDEDGFRTFAREAVAEFSHSGIEDAEWEKLAPRLDYATMEEGSFDPVRAAAPGSERLVYLAVPPSAIGKTMRALRAAELLDGARVIIEKPFGHDLESARRLNSEMYELLDESQILRIDHYMGKETVQNILVFRFGNTVFERIWNRDTLDHVEISVAESIGIEGRGKFYEEAGALRDIVQNHLLQVMSLLAMEPPISLSAEAIRDEKAKLLKAVRPIDPSRAVRGQYVAGEIDGERVSGYRQETNVAPDSKTETFFAAELAIDTWRWAGIPFYIRTGKRLPRRATEVTLGFKDVPLAFFEGTDAASQMRPNHLTMRIQPDEGITLSIVAKSPGPEIRTQRVHMDFSYDESFMTRPAEAYERLLHDALDDDRTLFLRQDAVERAWAVVQPALDDPPPVHEYAAGTWGPPQAADLIAPRTWHLE
jgi:glucose-6-phosphate 1-dehydrogenase